MAAAMALAAPAHAAIAGPEAPGRLPTGVVPVHYALTLAPDAGALAFTGEVVIDVDVKARTARVVLNAADLVIASARIDGRAARVSLDAPNETLTLTPARPLPPGRHRLQLAFSGRVQQVPAGLFALDYPADGGTRRMLSMQMEPGDARRVLPLWDEPAFKATFDVSVRVPRDHEAYGNMPVASRQPRGDATLVRFARTPRMSTYLLHVTSGELERLSTTVQGVDVGIVTRRGVKQQGAFALQAATQVLRLYNDFFGTPYPLPKLDLIAVPGTSQFFGAMENWGAILFMEPYLLLDPALSTESDRQGVFSIVAHEVAHQWFGNLVTMRWWDDLWLNEGFATWMDHTAVAALRPEWQSWEQVAVGARERAMRADARPSTHAIVQPVPNVRAAAEAFDVISYSKGMAVIHMIEAVAGADAFRAGLRSYMRRHAYANAVTDDLWTELERQAERPIRAIAQDFTRQPGVPLLQVSAGPCANGSTPVTLRQARFETGAPDDRDPVPRRWRLPVQLRAGVTGAVTTVLLQTPQMQFSLPGCAPVLANVGGTGYFRVAYDPAAAAALGRVFDRLPALDQLVRLSDAWALGENGDAPVGDWLELVARMPADAEPLVVMQAAQVLNTLDRLYAGDPGRAALRGFARARLRPVFDRIGWLRRDGEADNVAVLRERLIVALARYGDADVLAEARARFASGDVAQLPAAIRQPVLDAVSEPIDGEGWDALAARAGAATSPVERRQLHVALGNAADPALAQRTLDLALSGRLEPTLSAALIGAVGGVHPDLAFRFGVARQDGIVPLLETGARWSFIPYLAAASADAATADAVQAYMQAVIPADAQAGAREVLAAVRFRARVKAQRLPDVTAWLQAR